MEALEAEDPITNFVIVHVLMFGLLAAGGDPKSDLDRFQGTWVMVDREICGQKDCETMIMGGEYHLMFDGNAVIVNQEGRIV